MPTTNLGGFNELRYLDEGLIGFGIVAGLAKQKSTDFDVRVAVGECQDLIQNLST